MEELLTKGFMSKMEQLGVNSLEQLLLYLPSKYLDYRTPASSISSCLNKDKSYLKLRLVSNPTINESSKPNQIKLQFTDGVMSANAMCFGGAFQWRHFKAGDYVHMVGKVELYNGNPQIKGLELVPMREQGRVVPHYKGKEKVIDHQKISENMAVALREYSSMTVNYVCRTLGVSEMDVIDNAGEDFASLADVFRAVHRPKSPEEAALVSGVVRNINAYHAILMSLNLQKKSSNPDSVISYGVDLIKSLLGRLKFALTNDQKRTIWDITKDLNSQFPMDRLVSGDVGCGKTLAYAVPAVCAQKQGKTVIILMPNLLLAKQVADEISGLFPEVPTRLIIGGKKDNSEIQNGEIIVGTSAILWWIKKQKNNCIDFLIIDEQQKLGSKQKKQLIGEHTNFLEATATAIPKTSALVKYGGKQVSIIQECPVKKSIVTSIVGSNEKRAAYNKLIDIVKQGYQIAVLYPIRKKEFQIYDFYYSHQATDHNTVIEALVEMGASINHAQFTPSEDADDELLEPDTHVIRLKANGPTAKRITEYCQKNSDSGFLLVDVVDSEDEENCKRSVEAAAKQWEEIFPGRVVMIHGGLSTDDKIEAIRKAKACECDVIITSSVIEIGLTMPELRGLLVVDADKYGASTLHQFRGRLARNGGEGQFFMAVNCTVPKLSEKSFNRLNLLVKYKNGFDIAAEDMLQRGFGDLSVGGIKQAGYVKGIFPDLKLIPQDIENLLVKKHKKRERNLTAA
ncbi:ATP-dependent DNA helicase RecG [compost metagenome]